MLQAAWGNRTVIVDLSQTTFMGSTGLRSLLQVLQFQTAAGHDLVLRDPSDPVLLTLRYAGLEDVFTVEHRDDPKTDPTRPAIRCTGFITDRRCW
jgi:anti-anti-sigma factor